MELWGGIECTINRVGDSYHDQCMKNGHDRRWDADLDDFAAIGFKKLRYPVLWEKVAPRDPHVCDFGDADRRLEKLRSGLGIEPILGLLHHGSGPAYTNLLDPEFADKFAVYAREVAEHFPWAEWYTPVNEPLTTARFSGLYGVWYPHAKDDASFGRALFNEIKATILAMREVRFVNPRAKLVQTDDLGRASGTELLQYQIDFENERRWLTYDLLLGRVDRLHFMYEYLIEHAKITADELAWIRDNACPPDVIGVNHYPLSNRFLDHRLELYPSVYHGGNGRHRYVDVGAVDSGQAEPPMPYDILREVQERYDRPFAVTEAHIAGGREEQMRWFLEVWRAGERLEREGAKLQAVTAWSLLGAYDWRTLCTTCGANGVYESGIFDLRSPGRPRPTALAKMLPALAKGEWVDHPVLDHPGYWRESRRILFAPPKSEERGPQRKSRPLAITGGRGTLGRAFARLCEKRGIDYVLLTRQDVDIVEADSVRDFLARVSPWAVINAAGYVRVDDAEAERERCFRENAHGAKVLAEVAGEAGLPLLTFSTDLVFDGKGDRPYLESHETSPLNAYGASKAEAERWVRTAHPGSLVVRTSSFFGPWDEANFAHHVLTNLHRGEVVRAARDVVMSPTYVPHLVDACLDLLIDGETGILHLTNEEHLSWSDWAKRIATLFDLDPALVTECESHDLQYRALRPRYSALSSERMQVLPTFEEAMFEWKKQKGIS